MSEGKKETKWYDFSEERRFIIVMSLLVCLILMALIHGPVSCEKMRYEKNYELLSGRLSSDSRYVGDDVENGPINR